MKTNFLKVLEKPHDVVVCGVPKSGTNATELVCSMLGAKPSHHIHAPPIEEVYKNKKVVYVVRNPRNVLLSMTRARNSDKVTEEKLLSIIYNFYAAEEGYHDSSIGSLYKSMRKWMFLDSVHQVRYEDLVSDPSEISRIASYLGVDIDNPRSIIDTLREGGTPTWTGNPSRWENAWSRTICKAWEKNGMVEEEKFLGYNC